MASKQFVHNILILGFGAVSQCTLPILLSKINIACSKITIIDFEDKRAELQKYLDQGLHFVQVRVSPENMHTLLSSYLDQDGLLIDLSWSIDTADLVRWCHDHGVLYINTSVEVWDTKGSVFRRATFKRSLYARQMDLRDLAKNWRDSPTAILDHGANPGLISHFTKQGLLDIAERVIDEKKMPGKELEQLQQYSKDKSFPGLAQQLGVKVIHCSERDTQIADKPRKHGEFVGTWSVKGLWEEGIAPVELGWGTHEEKLPPRACIPSFGPGNQIFLSQMGINTWARSWVPKEEIVGMLIRHGEAFGLSHYLTLRDEEQIVYRPSVYYVYMPCNETLSSLCELRARRYKLPSTLRIMRNEIKSGSDKLGALLMGHPYSSWWTGSLLSIRETRQQIAGQNATTMQVAIGIVAAILWMMDHPMAGIKLPDDLPHDYILEIAKPYLGKFVSEAVNWTPLKNRAAYFREEQVPALVKDPWQFENFLLTP